jgi:hypothetical protein
MKVVHFVMKRVHFVMKTAHFFVKTNDVPCGFGSGNSNGSR